MLYTDELDYELPPELIARNPVHPRDRSRLLVYRRGADCIEDCFFSDLPALLSPKDLLVANDTRVLPAKLTLRKESGGKITGLFIDELSPGKWRVMLRTRGRAAPGLRLAAMAESPDARIELTLLERESEKGQWIAEVSDTRPAHEVLARIGHVPLPPYIEKARDQSRQPPERDSKRILPHAGGEVESRDGTSHDAEDYQTIYARAAGALAAPTAGLHFTPEVFAALEQRRIARAFVTLHVGLGTFLPVEAKTLDRHPMHQESFMVPRVTVESIRRHKAAQGRMVLVGTTTVRTLETMASAILDVSRPAEDLSGATRLLIQPGYDFQLTDALITNFHLPRSTLLALVGALTGLTRLKEIYRHAIMRHYRFYSFGDAMLILP